MEVETLSDHVYIYFEYQRTNMADMAEGLGTRSMRRKHPRWGFKDMDADLFREVLEYHVGAACEVTEADNAANWIGRVITEACDAAACRWGTNPVRKKAYWWSPQLDALRQICIRSRRRWMRLRRHRDAPGLPAAEIEYRVAKRMFRGEIKKAKREAWQDLILSVNKDPWGLPYKMVLDRLRRTVPRLTETISPTVLSNMLDALFPGGETHRPSDA